MSLTDSPSPAQPELQETAEPTQGTSTQGVSSEEAEAEFPPRRSFLYQFWAGFLGLLAGLVPASIAVPYFLDPIVRKDGEDDEGSTDFVPVANVDSLPPDGTPMQFTIFKDRVDKWNMFPNERVGSVWLRKDPESGEIVAFNSVCPHLGCTVDYRPANADFYCPCHASAFDLEGERLNAIPPRPMDSLQTKVEDGEVLVAFQNFQGGTHDKEPIA